MDKKFKTFFIVFLSFILSFSNIFDFFTLNNEKSSGKVYAANSKVNIPLNFIPTDLIINPQL